MADDNTLNIRVTADVSSLQAGMATAASATQDFATRTQAAMQAYNEVASGTAAVQKMLASAFDQAVVSGKNTVEAMEAAVASVRGYSSAAGEAAEKSDILTAAERQFASATLEAVAARKLLSSAVSSNLGKSDQKALDEVAASQARDAAAVENLALAKANLGEVQEYVATTAAQEADSIAASAESTAAQVANINALGEAYAKLDAEILGVEGTVLSNVVGSTGTEAQVGEVTDLSAAYAQLAEATLEAAAAKQELNDAITMYAGRSDEEAITATAAAQRQATQATEQLVLAKRNLAEVEEYSANAANMESAALNGNTEALVETTAATEALSGAQETSVSASMAAQGALRTMEGSMFGASRAAGELLTKTLGLGPVLEAAFPIIGAVALISILYQVGDAAYQAYEKANQAGDKINEAYSDASDKIQETTDQIELQNSKLQDEIDKLEGHPSNGLQTALRQDVVEADKLQDALDGVLKKILSIDQNKNLQVSFTESLISNAPSSTGVAKETANIVNSARIETQQIHAVYQQELTVAGTDQVKIVSATKKYHDDIAKAISDANAQLQPLLDQNVALQQSAVGQNLAITAALGAGAARFLTQTDYSARINDIKGPLAELQELKSQMQAMEAQSPLQQKVKQLQGDKSGESAANKAEEQHLRDLETQFTEEKILFGKSAEQAAAYWEQYVGDFKKGSSEYGEVVGKIASAQAEFGDHNLIEKPEYSKKQIATYWSQVSGAYQDGAEKFQNFVDRVYVAGNDKKPQGVIDKALVAETERLKKQADQDEKALWPMEKIPAGLQKKLDKINAATEKLQAKALEATAQHGSDEQLDRMETAQAREQSHYDLSLIKDPQAQMKELRAYHAQVAAEEEKLIQKLITIDAKYPEEVKRLDHKLEEVRRKADLQWIKDTENASLQIEKTIQKAYQKMETDINQMLAKTLSGQETWTNAAIQLYRKVSENFIANVLKMTEQYIIGLLLQKQGALSQIEVSAKTAAANTYSDVSAIPVVGAVLAPPAAAAAFAAVMAFGSFEAGGVVAGSHGMPVPIMAHAGERVLSAPQTQNFERMVNQPAKSGNTFNLNYNGQVNAYDRNGMRSTLKSHAGDILDIVKQGWNSGALR